jgi:hypothetical protein
LTSLIDANADWDQFELLLLRMEDERIAEKGSGGSELLCVTRNIIRMIPGA